MGLLNKFFNRNTPLVSEKRDQSGVPIDNPNMWDTTFMGGHSSPGGTALGLATVLACVRVISESVASLPLELFEKKEGGNSEIAGGNELHYLINQEPSNRYTSFTWREAMQQDATLDGNGYSEILRDKNGTPTEIIYHQAKNITPKLTKGSRVVYEIKLDENKTRIIQPHNMVHVPAMCFNGIVGKSPLTIARETFESALAAQNYGGNLYKNGVRLSGVLQHPTELSDAAYNRLRDSWEKQYHGAHNAGKTAILESGLMFKEISMSPEDAQFIETRGFQNSEIARIFRVPLHLLQILDRATFSNIEQQGIDFVTHTIRPWIKRWEQELNRKLIPVKDRDKLFIRFNLNALMRGDAASRSSYYNTMFNIGALNPNDIRRLESMNTYEGGDKYYTPLNMTDDRNNEADV